MKLNSFFLTPYIVDSSFSFESNWIYPKTSSINLLLILQAPSSLTPNPLNQLPADKRSPTVSKKYPQVNFSPHRTSPPRLPTLCRLSNYLHPRNLPLAPFFKSSKSKSTLLPQILSPPAPLYIFEFPWSHSWTTQNVQLANDPFFVSSFRQTPQTHTLLKQKIAIRRRYLFLLIMCKLK